MYEIVKPIVYTKLKVFPNRKYIWKKMPCKLVRELHVIIKEQPKPFFLTAQADWESQVPSLFHPMSSGIPWKLFKNLKLLVIKPLNNDGIFPLQSLIPRNNTETIIDVNLFHSSDPCRRNLCGMLPKGAPVTHLIYSDIPYGFVFNHGALKGGWKARIPSVTHFQLQHQFAYSFVDPGDWWSVNCSLTSWNSNTVNMDWVKSAFPSLQMFILPLEIRPEGGSSVADTASDPRAPLRFRKFVKLIFEQLPKISILAFVVTTTRFSTTEMVMKKIEKWIRPLPEESRVRTVAVRDMRGNWEIQDGVTKLGEDIWETVELTLKERERRATV